MDAMTARARVAEIFMVGGVSSGRFVDWIKRVKG
jgi:hypothetical protein